MALRPNLKPRLLPSNGESSSGNSDNGGSNFEAPGANILETPGGNEVAIPEAVTFDPAAFFINLRDAIDAAHEEGRFNLDLFAQNFQQADIFTTQSLDTELRGLESFIPRTSNLIRRADAQGNADILRSSDVFDARNERQVRRATVGNVALRSQLSEAFAPGLFETTNEQRVRAKGDVARIRAREAKPFLSDVLKGVASRSARNRASDIAASTGLGVDSGAATNLLDRFDVDTRLKLEEADRQNSRTGDQAIIAAENAVTNTGIQSQNLFNSVIAPGILDFKPIQPVPRVTDIGGQIRPMPAIDAGSIRREFTGQLNQVSMIQPSQVFTGSLDVQKYNSGVGIQALGFQQAQNNTAANALNTGFNLDKGDQQFQAQLDAFQSGLDRRSESENRQATTQLITSGLGVLGGLASDYLNSGSDPNSPEGTKLGGFIQTMIGLGKEGYNAVSNGLSNLGIDIGQFNTGGNNVPQGGSFGGINDAGTVGGIGVGVQAPSTSDQYLDSLTQNDFGSGNQDTSGFWGGDFNFDGEGVANQDVGFDSNFSGFDIGSDFNVDTVARVARTSAESTGVEVLKKQDVVESFRDPAQRPGVIDRAASLGMSASTVTSAYNLYDNWDNLSDTQRRVQSAQLLNNLASTAGLVDGTVPGAVVSLFSNSANTAQNWDKMSDGQRVRSGGQIAGSIGALAAVAMGAGGPVGAAIVFGAAAFSRAAQVAIDQGINGKQAFSQVFTPLESTGVDQLNSLTGNQIGKNDATNLALAASGPIGWAALAYDIAGGDLDFTSGKPRTQQFRDALRGGLQKIGVTDKNHQIKLAGGNSFDLGKDGKAKLQNYGTNIDGKTERAYSDVDFSNPLSGQIVGWTDPLSVIMFQNQKGRAFTGNITNAVMSTDPTSLTLAKTNAKDIAIKGGYNYSNGIKVLDSLLAAGPDKGGLSKAEYDAYRNGWMDLMLK